MLDVSTSVLYSEGFCSAYGRCDLGEFKALVISTNYKKKGVFQRGFAISVECANDPNRLKTL